ncbi:helix-turn-helix domain-containing protein [Arthrobacter zhaoguopingii]|uniref:helix-turn-helix domain-containing protein n=1 Tax=Arthrobacter zhaoguopingii TaxID=2681491 RepID=UPI00135B4014|nr:helix-turn-helix domain-containing protein [Arthrobacter zhaoguopingii]
MSGGQAHSVPPRKVAGKDALAALAVPARFAILDHLLASGPATASQCAKVVGETASNCSWHLRALAKVGLVERAETAAGDGRDRPWKATATGFDFSGDGTPAGELAGTALESVAARNANAAFDRYLAHRSELSKEWQDAAGTHRYHLVLTAAELTALLASIDDLVRPYVRPHRAELPQGSQVVQLQIRSFPDNPADGDV